MALGISLEKGPGGPRCVQHEQTLLKCSHVSRSSKSQCCVPQQSELGATFRKLLNTGEAQVADSGNFRHGDVLLLGVSPRPCRHTEYQEHHRKTWKCDCCLALSEESIALPVTVTKVCSMFARRDWQTSQATRSSGSCARKDKSRAKALERERRRESLGVTVHFLIL